MDKPDARRNGWELLRTEYPYTHAMFRIRADWLRWPDGVERSFTYWEAKPAVLVVPVTSAGEVVLIRQFRYIVDEWLWEVPAGGSHDFAGDDLVELVRRELREEIGGEAEAIKHIGTFHPMPGAGYKLFYLYLATGVRVEENHPEPGELIEVHPIPVERALEMARSGEIACGPSAYALLRCEPQLRALATGTAI